MEVNLGGRTAVITGASKGIGLAIARRFSAACAEVAIIARGQEALDDAVKTIRASSRARVAAVQADVALAADLRRVYDEAMRLFGKIDIVVNNAGTSRTGAFEAITDEVWREGFDEKKYSAVPGTRPGWAPVKGHRWGRATNTPTITGTAPRPRTPAPAT